MTKEQRPASYFMRWDGVYERLWADRHINPMHRKSHQCRYRISDPKCQYDACCGAPVPTGQRDFCTYHAEKILSVPPSSPRPTTADDGRAGLHNTNARLASHTRIPGDEGRHA